MFRQLIYSYLIIHDKFEERSKSYVHGMIFYLGTESPFIVGSRYSSMLPASSSGTWLIPRSCCILCHTKSLGGLRRTNKAKIRTPWRAFTRSKEDQSNESPLTNQNISSIVQLRAIKTKTIMQTNVVLMSRRRYFRSSRSDSWFLARRLKSRSLWYLVNLTKVRTRKITFPTRSNPIGM